MRPQVVHCHDLDALWLGRRAATAVGARLVFDAHENFPDMMAGHLPSWMVGALRVHKRRLVRWADLVITVGERLRRHYQHLGARRTALVGNWKDPAKCTFPAQQVRRLREQLGIGERLAVAFIANLGARGTWSRCWRRWRWTGGSRAWWAGADAWRTWRGGTRSGTKTSGTLARWRRIASGF